MTGFGWRPNRVDARDWDEQKLGLASAPAGSDILHMVGLHSTLNQINTSSCTGHGVVQELCVAVRAAYKRAHPEATLAQIRASCPIGSPLFAYFGGRKQEDPDSKVQDVGAFPRLVKQFVSTHHVPPYADWPTLAAKVNHKPSPKAFIHGMRPAKAKFYFFKTTGAARLDAVDAALAADKPVGFGTGVDDAMSGRTGEVVLDVPKGSITGLHYLCCIGMKHVNGRRLYAVVQSYGTGYGIDGIFWMTDEYLAWHMTSDVGIVDSLGGQL